MIEAICCGMIAGLLMMLFLTNTNRKPNARRCRNGRPHEWGDWKQHGYTYNQRTCKVCNYTMTE